MQLLDLARGEMTFDSVSRLLHVSPTEVLKRGFNYSDPLGSTALRSTFVDRLATIATHIDDTVVTHGALGALDLAIRGLRPRRFVTFDPCYREALSIARSHQLPVVPLPRLRPDTDIDAISAALLPDDLVYIVPTFNNPDGITLTSEEAGYLHTVIARSGATLFEDDAYGLLARDASRESVAGLLARHHPTASVVRAQSFSKVVAPGSRCCVVEGTTSAMNALTTMKLDFGTAPLVAEFIAVVLEGDFQRLRTTLSDELEMRSQLAVSELSEWPGLIKPVGGYFLWLAWPGADSSTLVADIAEATAVKVSDGRHFQVNMAEACPHTRISVAWPSHDELAEGCRRLRTYRQFRDLRA